MSVTLLSVLSSVQRPRRLCTVVLGAALIFSACGTGEEQPKNTDAALRQDQDQDRGGSTIPIVTVAPEAAPSTVGDDDRGADKADPPPLDLDEVDEDLTSPIDQRIVGISEADAIALGQAEGYTVRVEARDGESFEVSQEYDKNRLNLTVKDDKVVSVRVG